MPCGGPSSRCAQWPSPSRSVTGACPGGCPVFREPAVDAPGGILRVPVTVAVVVAAVIAGLLTSLAAPAAVAVVAGVTAAVGGQAIRGRLEHAADRWILGSRRAGYANLNRFGRSLVQVTGSAELLRGLAGEVRRGLGLTWARVSLDAADGPLREVTD